MKKIKILIADDHSVVRLGLGTLLATEKDFEVVGEADDGESAIRTSMRTKPDIIIMDLMMPGLDGAAATQEVIRQLPGTKVLILTTFGYSDSISQAIKAGASGAMLKSTSDAALISALRKVANGETVISNEIRELMSNDPPAPVFTKRQLSILESVTKGHTNREIANSLGIREDSVSEHLTAIFAKLGATNRSEAVAKALRKHLLKI